MRKISTQEKLEIERNILEDPYMIPETKLVLIWMLRHNRFGKLEDKEAVEKLHISKYKLGIVKKQLKELNLIKFEYL